MTQLPRVLVHADESCLGNQFTDRDNPGGAGGLVETWTNDAWVRRDFWISEPGTTNNRMAIKSAIEALGALTKRCEVTFVSDSQYLIKGMSEWVKGWKARGWIRKTGPIENLELWQELEPLGGRHDVSWCWVRGHAGHPKNEYANHLATRAAASLSASGGLIESGFEVWLLEQREKRKKYLDYNEAAPPGKPGCQDDPPPRTSRRPK